MTDTRDVIVIGGGLSGLSAAYELEKQRVAYTLIEVKPRLGGGVFTEKSDGFVMDGGVFAFPRPASWPTVQELGLWDDLFPVQSLRHDLVAFENGTQSLTDALSARLNGAIVQRMAVTGIGYDDDDNTYTVCLENGLALQARGVIVAASARFAERMFRTLDAEIAETLDGYHYDEVTQVALGYTAANRPDSIPPAPPSMTIAGLNHTEHPSRVPEGGLLIQASLRLPRLPDERWVPLLTEMMDWPAPDVSLIGHWAESDPLTVTGPPSELHRLNDRLPQSVRLVGSCYRVLTLPERTELARDAARTIIASLREQS